MGRLIYRKKDSPILDGIMAERRAQGLSPPHANGGGGKGNGGKGFGNGNFGNGSFGNKGFKGMGKGAYGLDFPGIDAWGPPPGIPGQEAATWAQPGGGPPVAPNLQQLTTSWSGGWTGRLCNVLERCEPQVDLQVAEAEKVRKLTEKHQARESQGFEVDQ